MLQSFPLGISESLSSYSIANASLFDGVNGNLSRTFGTPTTQNVFSLAFLIQRHRLDETAGVFGGAAANTDALYFNGSANTLKMILGGAIVFETTAVFRDTAAFLPCLLTLNGTTATFTIDNVVVGTGTGTVTDMNSAVAHTLGSYNGAANFTHSTFSNVIFVDGASPAFTDFYQLDAVAGIWKPKTPVVPAYGNNGAFLDSADSLNLGKDVSGNANNFTVTGGVSQVTSTPTNVVATPNPLDINAAGSRTFSDGNRKIVYGATSWYNGVRGSLLLPHAVPVYWESSFTASANIVFGVANSSWDMYQGYNGDFDVWTFTNHPTLGFQLVYDGASSGWLAGHTNTSSSIFQMARNGDKFWIGIDNIYFDSSGGTTGNPSTGANPTFMITGSSAVNFMPCWNDGNGSNSCQTYIEPSTWAYLPPTGFKALTTNNLPARSPKVPTSPQTGSFTGNALADGPFINLGMAIDKAGVSTINGNAITWGTHADATAVGSKIRTALAAYNAAGSNTYSFAVKTYTGGSNVPPATAQGNP